MDKAKLNLRETFLRMYVYQLIKNFYIAKTNLEILPKQEINFVEKEKISAIPEQFNQSEKIKISNQNQLRTKPLIKTPLPKKQISEFPPKDKNAPSALQAHKPTPPPISGVRQEPVKLGKLTKILLDPSVQSIEIPGAGKNVLVNRSGTIQTSPIILTTIEINNLMQEVSNKTRIPLIQGLFKAAFQDLVLTAVISEHIGTRFMIQKMNPFQQYG